MAGFPESFEAAAIEARTSRSQGMCSTAGLQRLSIITDCNFPVQSIQLLVLLQEGKKDKKESVACDE